MANRNRREAFRGAEEQTFDVLVEVLTSEQWGELLRAPLEHAAAEGSRDMTQKLVGAGADIGDALHEAARGGHVEIVDDLLENGASVAAKDTTNGRTPLHVAAGEGTTEMVQLLLLKGADKDAVDNDRYTPIYLAARADKVDVALALLAAGADVGPSQRSAMHAAARHGNVDIMRAAIDHGAQVDAVDGLERTPLHIAALNHRAGAIDMLVEAGSNIEARDDGDCTPLHHAAGRPALEASSALLNHGADVNSKDERLWTPLHCAAARAGTQGALEVVDSLLRAGADETILDDEGKAAADVVGDDVVGEIDVNEDIDPVRDLLVNAPVDRSWRRRGYLVLCRTHPDRVQQMQHISGATAGAARWIRSIAKLLGRTETGNCTGTLGGDINDEDTSGDWAVVVARVLGLQEEGIFRTIVGYL